MYNEGMDGHLFSTSDNDYLSNVVMVIQDIYPGNGDLEVDLTSLLNKIEEIFLLLGDQITEAELDKLVNDIDLLVPKVPPSVFDYMVHHSVFNDTIPCRIREICSQMSYRCSGDVDTHATTVALLGMLSSYSLHAKVVIVFAAFAVNYGKFWLVTQLYPSKSVAIFEKLPRIFDNSTKSDSKLLGKLMETMLHVVKGTVVIKELSLQSTFEDIAKALEAPELYDIESEVKEEMLDKAHIPEVVYWTIRGIVASTSQIMSIIGLKDDCRLPL